MRQMGGGVTPAYGSIARGRSCGRPSHGPDVTGRVWRGQRRSLYRQAPGELLGVPGADRIAGSRTGMGSCRSCPTTRSGRYRRHPTNSSASLETRTPAAAIHPAWADIVSLIALETTRRRSAPPASRPSTNSAPSRLAGSARTRVRKARAIRVSTPMGVRGWSWSIPRQPTCCRMPARQEQEPTPTSMHRSGSSTSRSTQRTGCPTDRVGFGTQVLAPASTK